MAVGSRLGWGNEPTEVGRLSWEEAVREKTTAAKPKSPNAASTTIKTTPLLSCTFCPLRHSFPIYVPTTSDMSNLARVRPQ